MPESDVVRCTVLAHLADGQSAQNTFYLHKAGLGVPGLTELTNLEADLDTYFRATWLSLLTTNDKLYSISTFSVPNPTIHGDPYLEYTGVVNVAGTVSYARNAPETVCGVMSIKTAVAKRYARGHMFAFPCWRQDNLQDGAFFVHGGGYIGNVVTAAAKFATGAGPSPSWTGSHLSGYTLCVFSKQQNGTVGAAITDASNVVCDERVHWLKSRLRGTT